MSDGLPPVRMTLPGYEHRRKSGDKSMKTYMSGKPKRKWVMPASAGVMLIVAAPTWSVSLIDVAKLFAADGGEGDQFGYSVAVSGDTALIGVRFDDANGLESGSVYIFTGLLDVGDEGV